MACAPAASLRMGAWRIVGALGPYVAGTAAGLLASRVGIPLPWIIGPLLCVAGLSLAGCAVTPERRTRDLSMTILLTSLGLGFTPEMVAAAVDHLPAMVLVAAATVAFGCAASRLLAVTAKTDPVTAFYASIPGGPVEMSVMGERHGAVAHQIAMSQLLRIVGLVLLVPNALALCDVGGDVFPPDGGRSGVGLSYTLATCSAAFALSVLARRVGLQTAFLLVPLGSGMIISLAGFSVLPAPAWLSAAAQCGLGVFLGAQFRRDSVVALRSFIGPAILNVLVLIGGSLVIAITMAMLAGISVPAAILATAPGGVTEMALTARSLHFDAATVTAFHIVRIFVVLASAPVVFAGLRRAGFFDAP
jgi:uncharacterized protein